MAKYRCSVCGYIYDEDREGAPFHELTECPVCHQPAEKFTVYEEEHGEEPQEEREVKLDYPKEFIVTLPFADIEACITRLKENIHLKEAK